MRQGLSLLNIYSLFHFPRVKYVEIDVGVDAVDASDPLLPEEVLAGIVRLVDVVGEPYAAGTRIKAGGNRPL